MYQQIFFIIFFAREILYFYSNNFKFETKFSRKKLIEMHESTEQSSTRKKKISLSKK